MEEKEFLLYLNNIAISDDYNDQYLKHLFQTISMFFKPQSMENTIFKRKNETNEASNTNMQITETIIIKIECINAELIIKNPQRKLENPTDFIKFLESILNNIFKNKQIQEKLKMEKDLDGLLNVLNRNAYERLLEKDDTHQNVGIAFIDVNGLGVENNMYGHDAGDKMLQTIASCIKNVFRLKDIYRIGGDELVIICKDIPAPIFEEKLDKVLKLISLTEYSVCYGSIYKLVTTDLKQSIKEASTIMEQNKERFHREHPEKYKNKYEVSFVGKKN